MYLIRFRLNEKNASINRFFFVRFACLPVCLIFAFLRPISSILLQKSNQFVYCVCMCLRARARILISCYVLVRKKSRAFDFECNWLHRHRYIMLTFQLSYCHIIIKVYRLFQYLRYRKKIQVKEDCLQMWHDKTKYICFLLIHSIKFHSP